MISLVLGLLAGALTTLSPCVLPVLPFVVLAALDRHRFGPIALAAGMAAAFAAVGVAVSAAGASVDVRSWAASLMALFGVLLLSTRLQQRLAALTAPLTAKLGELPQRLGTGGGPAAQFGLGALLGAAWSPCSGPTLGAAISLAASGRTVAQAAATMLLFALGATLPLLALAYGSKAALQRRKAVLQQAGWYARPLVGSAMVLAAALILSGWDRLIEASLVQVMPDWLTTLTTQF